MADGVDVDPGDALTAPQALSLWGRGLAGEWELSIADSEIELHDIDLAPITEIQLWLVLRSAASHDLDTRMCWLTCGNG